MKIIYQNPRGPRPIRLEQRFIRCAREKHELGPLSDNDTKECIEQTRTKYTEVMPERANELVQWLVKDILKRWNEKQSPTIYQRFRNQHDKYAAIIEEKQREIDDLKDEDSRLREQIKKAPKRMTELEIQNKTLYDQLTMVTPHQDPNMRRTHFFRRISRK